MPNAIYPKFKEALISGGANTNLSTGDVRVILIDANDYTYSAAHEFLSSVPGAARVATLAAGVTGKSVTDGVFDCADFSWASVTGDQSEAILVFVHTGSDATARLVAYIDTGVSGLPVTPNGQNIDFTVNASGLFAL